jgi:hypothetical protein
MQNNNLVDKMSSFIKAISKIDSTSNKLNEAISLFNDLKSNAAIYKQNIGVMLRSAKTDNLDLENHIKTLQNRNFENNFDAQKTLDEVYQSIDSAFVNTGNKNVDNIVTEKANAFKKEKEVDILVKPAVAVYSYLKNITSNLLNLATKELGTSNTIELGLNKTLSDLNTYTKAELLDKIINISTLYDLKNSEYFLDTETDHIAYSLHTIITQTSITLYNASKDKLSIDDLISNLVEAKLLMSSDTFEKDKNEFIEQYKLANEQHLTLEQIYAHQLQTAKKDLEQNFTLENLRTQLKYSLVKNIGEIGGYIKSAQENSEKLEANKNEISDLITKAIASDTNYNLANESLKYCSDFFSKLFTDNDSSNAIQNCSKIISANVLAVFAQLEVMYTSIADAKKANIKQMEDEEQFITTSISKIEKVLENYSPENLDEIIFKLKSEATDLLKHTFYVQEENHQATKDVEDYVCSLGTCTQPEASAPAEHYDDVLVSEVSELILPTQTDDGI